MQSEDSLTAARIEMLPPLPGTWSLEQEGKCTSTLDAPVRAPHPMEGDWGAVLPQSMHCSGGAAALDLLGLQP